MQGSIGCQREHCLCRLAQQMPCASNIDVLSVERCRGHLARARAQPMRGARRCGCRARRRCRCRRGCCSARWPPRTIAWPLTPCSWPACTRSTSCCLVRRGAPLPTRLLGGALVWPRRHGQRRGGAASTPPGAPAILALSVLRLPAHMHALRRQHPACFAACRPGLLRFPVTTE